MSSKKDKLLDKSLATGWERALAEAEYQITQHKRKIRELTRSLSILKGKIESGEPWPLAQVTDHKSQQQHGV